MQRARAAQVGLLMRSYRESFSPIGGRRGLTQEAVLERMGSVDSDYAERYSHATVSPMGIWRHPPHSPAAQQSELA